MEFKTLVSVETLRQHLSDPNCAIFDVRFELNQPAQGQQEYLKGHISGAVTPFWQDNLDKDCHLLPKEALRKEWEALLKDIPPQKTIVYCGSGVTGCFNVFATTLAGFEGARLYDGSWSQWLEDPDLPKVFSAGGEAISREDE